MWGNTPTCKETQVYVPPKHELLHSGPHHVCQGLRLSTHHAIAVSSAGLAPRTLPTPRTHFWVHFRPCPPPCHPTVLTRHLHRLSPIYLEPRPLVFRLAKLPRPTDDGCPHHFRPQSTCEFYLFRKGLCHH